MLADGKEWKDFFIPMPVIVAHRGDSHNYPENTLEAFASAVAMGVDVIETDIHLSKDGVPVIWHDPTLDRNTNGTGSVEKHDLAELKELDAGYSFTKDGGNTYPFREKGIRLATLEEALEASPSQRFNVDLKSNNIAIVRAFVDVVRKLHAQKRVIAASFRLENLKAVRMIAPEIQTSVTTSEVLKLLIRQKLHLLPRSFPRRIIFQVPVSQGLITVITPSFVRDMHERGAIIQVWTINAKAEMRRLLDMGVDSVMTDDPTALIEVVREIKIT
ncbi:glycerophosphoryl diester phosphodiesterase [Parasphaerochaeta coccoides DSM 17374]|uniref:Glycerophosphoryl diester phosphodiesterase n=2 Tax=Parasphaerochaeta TaxID=3062336 RepID=F4GH40_PARC1|nr:glycerophosphoryl diester phosphodiesterase [Parasphaerochaeta coccoides DSM 17374]